MAARRRKARGAVPDRRRRDAKAPPALPTSIDEGGHPVPAPPVPAPAVPAGPEYFITPEAFRQLLGEMGFIPGVNAKAYGIITHPSGTCDTGESVSIQYANLVDITGGIWGDICATDYSEILTKMSENVSALMHTEIKLRGVPVSRASVAADLDGKPLAMDWVVVGDSFILEMPLKPGPHLKISYKLDEFKDLPLADIPDPSSLRIEVNGVTAAPEDYYFDPQGNRVTFHGPLPEGVTVKAAYRENLTLPEVFAFPAAEPESILCKSGDRVLERSYFADHREIVFLPAPQDGQEITCEYLPLQ